MLRPYKFSGLVFGPAEGGEGLLEAREGQADDVEVAAFDAGDVAAGAALDGVSASLIVRLAGREIARDFFSGERGKVHQRGLDEGEPLGVGNADEGHAGDDGVCAAGKFFEHMAGIVGGARLAEDVVFEGDLGVRADDNGWTSGAGGDEIGLGSSKALDEVVGGFAGVWRFVDGGGEHGEGEASVAEDFGATGGSGGEDEFHGGRFSMSVDSRSSCWLGIRLLARFADHGIMLVKVFAVRAGPHAGRFFEGSPQQEASAESDDAEPGCSAADEPYAGIGIHGATERSHDYRSEISDHNITANTESTPNNRISSASAGISPYAPCCHDE